ncbi:MAG: hypothetical protein B6I31_03075 [Desulfobacteraceae bacterium 4572_19]|nr:MAG: hypothetical protein B6I31_03075 [Desulfobacteraceae bacterium 4572_19]
MGKNKISEKIKILLVSRKPEIIELFSYCLADDIFVFKVVQDVAQGLKTVRKLIPHIIICHLDTNGDDGILFCEDIRNNSLTSDLIFLLLSNKHDDSIWQKGYKAGVDDIVFLPVGKAVIASKIKLFVRMLSNRDMIDKLSTKYEKVLHYLDDYKVRYKDLSRTLSKEKELLYNSLKQITLMVKEREEKNKELVELNKFYHNNRQSLVSVLTEIITSRGGLHREHSKKVAEIAVFIAREQKLSSKDIDNIQTAALLHEAGLLLLPEVQMEECINDFAPKMMEGVIQHPVKGSALLEIITGFEDVAKIIRHIHEHADGTGYPDGFKRRKIPIGSRIISVANFFDTLAYRKRKFSVADVLKMIDREVGSKFDANIVYQLRRYINRYPEQISDRTVEINLYALKQGMKLAAAIFTIHGAMLLPEGTILSEESLNRILQYDKVDPLKEMVFITDMDG